MLRFHRFQRVIWTDEKRFFYNNHQTSMKIDTGALKPPWNCREQKGTWIQSDVLGRNGGWEDTSRSEFNEICEFEVYLEEIQKSTVGAVVKGSAAKRQYWFQQYGACCHKTAESFLETRNIIDHLIHLTYLLLTSPSMHKPWPIYAGTNLLPCMNWSLSWMTSQPI